jgi:isochorismate synthase
LSGPATGDAIARFRTTVQEAVERALGDARRVLASVTVPLPTTDPLTVLHAASEDPSPVRMYWTRPSAGFTLAGIDAALTLTPRGASRFSTADRDWRALLDDALVDDASSGAPGAGPALMGGFAFDPDAPRTARWRDFPATMLILPRVQLAVVNDQAWLTLNLVVTPGRDAAPDLAATEQLLMRVTDALASDVRVAAPVDAADEPPETSLASHDVRPATEWRAMVADAVRAIRDGAMEKVVLAREVRVAAPAPLDPDAALVTLRASYPDCYVFGIWHGDSAFVGATPERLVELEGSEVHASSLAGSISRGATPADDQARTAALMASDKDRAEHEVVRRTLCEGLTALCDDVVAPDTPSLLTLPQVHHLHTPVRATLRDGHTLLELVGVLHPTPAVGGAPRDDALRFIRDREQMDRGWYAAPIGWVQRARGEFAVALRSALVSGSDASLFAGCGVVADSDPEREYAESLLKLRPMELALADAVTTPEAASEGAASEVGAR